MDLPIRGLEDLAPLCSVLGLYLGLLVFLRLVVWPFIVALRRKNTLGKLLGGLVNLLLMVLVWGGLALLLISSLFGLGFGDTLTELFYTLTDIELGGLQELGTLGLVIIGFGLLLFLIFLFFLIRPIVSFVRARIR